MLAVIRSLSDAVFCRMLSAAGSRVRTSRRQGKGRESMVSEADCGEKWQESFAKWNPDTSSWKIRQLWLFEGLDESLETWPRWGLMRRGECLEQTPPDFLIAEPGCGWLATPLASDVRDRGDVNMPCIKRRFEIGKQVALSALFKGAQCPTCAEIIMDWPIEWSATRPLATARFQAWLRSHGVCSQTE